MGVQNLYTMHVFYIARNVIWDSIGEAWPHYPLHGYGIYINFIGNFQCATEILLLTLRLLILKSSKLLSECGSLFVCCCVLA